MSANSSPTAQAARLLSQRGATDRSGGHSASPIIPVRPVVVGERGCEWPRRTSSNPPFASVRATLQAIQARHA